RFGPRRPRPIDPAEQLGTGRPPSRLGRHPGAARLLLPRAGGLPGCAGRSGRALSLLDRSHEVVVSIPPLAVAFERHRRSLDLASPKARQKTEDLGVRAQIPLAALDGGQKPFARSRTAPSTPYPGQPQPGRKDEEARDRPVDEEERRAHEGEKSR